MTVLPVGPADVRAAAARLQGLVHRTPVLGSRLLDEATGATVRLKCENLQRAGSFKFRGATHVLALLSPQERARGVVTHSSGNHAQALALAGRSQGVAVTVVMPDNAPAVKRAATVAYGARIVTCLPTLAARETATEAVIAETGAVLVHPYDDARIIAGQGTAALELLADEPLLDVVLAPVGGGGLLSGTTLACLGQDRPVPVVGCEPRGADDAYRSLTTGVHIRSHAPDTIADGLLTTLGEIPFRVLSHYGIPVLLADDEEVRAAMRFIWERLKIVIEPSAAVPVAVLLRERARFAGQRVGVILSGGNVDLAPFFDRGPFGRT